MLTEGLNIEATGSWDSQSLYGESRYSMPALYLARERNQKRRADPFGTGHRGFGAV